MYPKWNNGNDLTRNPHKHARFAAHCSCMSCAAKPRTQKINTVPATKMNSTGCQRPESPHKFHAKRGWPKPLVWAIQGLAHPYHIGWEDRRWREVQPDPCDVTLLILSIFFWQPTHPQNNTTPLGKKATCVFWRFSAMFMFFCFFFFVLVFIFLFFLFLEKPTMKLAVHQLVATQRSKGKNTCHTPRDVSRHELVPPPPRSATPWERHQPSTISLFTDAFISLCPGFSWN